MRLWLGGYTSDMNGNASGIGALLAGAPAEGPSGALSFIGTAVTTDSPSWLVAHPTLDVVYAALEGAGAVRAFRRTGPETLTPLGTAQDAGNTTCHATVSPDGRWLTATAYGDGSVVRMPLGLDGRPGPAQLGDPASDPYAVGGEVAPAPAALTGGVDLDAALASLRAAAGDEFAHLLPEPALEVPLVSAPADAGPARTSRAHHARHLPGGLVATTDLGFDLVRFWRDGRLVQEVVLPFGCGPRHTVWHPSGHLYVVTEYSCEVFALAPDVTGRWRIVTAAQLSRECTIGTDFPAELTLSADGSHLYAGIRGIDALAVLRVRGAGDRLEAVATVETHVSWPRHHVVLGDTLLVAGQRSNEVASLAIDERTQVPGRRRHTVGVPSPTALLPIDD